MICDPEKINEQGRFRCNNCGSEFPGLYPAKLPPKRNCTSGKPPRLRNDCQHLGDSTTAKECTSCQGTVRIKLYACAIHGECTLGKKLDEIQTCAQCPDYAPSKRDPPVDDGRSG